MLTPHMDFFIYKKNHILYFKKNFNWKDINKNSELINLIK